MPPLPRRRSETYDRLLRGEATSEEYTAELRRWADTYGDPEEWAKRAQDVHARAERLQLRCDRLEAELAEVSAAFERECEKVEALKGDLAFERQQRADLQRRYEEARMTILRSDGT